MAQLIRAYLPFAESLVQFPLPCNWACCNLSTYEVETAGSEGQGYPWLHETMSPKPQKMSWCCYFIVRVRVEDYFFPPPLKIEIVGCNFMREIVYSSFPIQRALSSSQFSKEMIATEMLMF